MNAVIRPSKSISLTFDQIDFPANARPTNAMDVVALVSSIRAIGLQVPLTVAERAGRYLLIAGRHRLEALRVIGEERVPSASWTSTTSKPGCGLFPRTCTEPSCPPCSGRSRSRSSPS
jgi:ParB-like nuclease domain